MPDYPTLEHDVLIIGSGGAGLRAAIEASTAGVSVGLVCKCLLGKAHTVMAEGGIAAALGNVDERDNWKVHFADTMRGGQYVNNWRMAELHAKESPARVRELEAWGAVFDRTADGRILQRNFGGHKYPRLAHVGDRTGLEMIRTLQDHGVHQGIDVHMEQTILSLLKDGERVVGAFGYERERGRFKIFRAKAVVLATGGIGRAYKITSNSWEYTGDGHALAYEAGAESKKGGGVRTVACFWIFRGSGRSFRMQRNTSNASCRACIISLSNLPISILQKSQWKLDRLPITSWAECGSIRTRRCRA